jgi:hypothetical protein
LRSSIDQRLCVAELSAANAAMTYSEGALAGRARAFEARRKEGAAPLEEVRVYQRLNPMRRARAKLLNQSNVADRGS